MNSLIKCPKLRTTASWLACSLISFSAWAYPIDPSKQPVNIEVPDEVVSYTLAYDSFDNKVIYVQPHQGVVATLSGQPLVGLAKFNQNGVTRAFLNMSFEFSLPKRDRELLFGAIREAGYQPRPFPFFKTKVIPQVPGWDLENNEKVCTETLDPFTGTIDMRCASLVDRIRYSENGPTLGENIGVSVILSQEGTQVINTLLRSGNAFMVELKAQYHAASPAFTAKIEVNYQKLSESFAAFAAYHDGRCIDIEMSAFWQNTVMCDKDRPEDCSVKVTYTDQNGRTVNNLYADPDEAEESDIAKFFEAIEGLRSRFEEEMLTKVTPANVSRDKSAYFTLRSDYKRVSEDIHFVLERKSLGRTKVAETTVMASILCTEVDDQGYVSKAMGGDCPEFWEGDLSAEDYLGEVRREGNGSIWD